MTTKTLTLDVGGKTCAACVGRVGRGLKKVDGVQDAAVNLATERATVTYLPATTSPAALQRSVNLAAALSISLFLVAAGVLAAWNITLSPVMAAAMGLSSVFVLSNALRLRGFKPPLGGEASTAGGTGQPVSLALPQTS